MLQGGMSSNFSGSPRTRRYALYPAIAEPVGHGETGRRLNAEGTCGEERTFLGAQQRWTLFYGRFPQSADPAWEGAKFGLRRSMNARTPSA